MAVLALLLCVGAAGTAAAILMQKALRELESAYRCATYSDGSCATYSDGSTDAAKDADQ